MEPTSAAGSGNAYEGPPALRLSEVLADATDPGVDRAYEWVELVNTATMSVSTGGWALGDADALDILPAIEVPPGGFVVVAGEAAVLPAGALVIRLPDGAIGAGLRNTGDAVRLLSPAGDLVDALSFGENESVFTPALPAASSGMTLGARAHGEQPARERWSRTLRPSPGAPNLFPELGPSPSRLSRVAEGEETGAREREETANASQSIQIRLERDTGSHAPWIVLGAVVGASAVLVLAATGPALRGVTRVLPGRNRDAG